MTFDYMPFSIQIQDVGACVWSAHFLMVHTVRGKLEYTECGIQTYYVSFHI